MNRGAGVGLAAIIAAPLALIFGLLLVVVILDEDSSDAAAAAGSCDLSGQITLVDTSALPGEVAGYSGRQLENAAIIIDVAASRGLSERAAAIAVMTAMRESTLLNLANAGTYTPPASWTGDWAAQRSVAILSVDYPNDGVADGDWDSVGLFQGRPSQGWGGDGEPAEQIQNLLNPTYTAGRFLDALVAVPGWENMLPAVAAQTVQRSAFPDAYTEDWQPALDVVAALVDVEVTRGECGQYPGTVSAGGWVKPVAGASYSSEYGMRINPVTGAFTEHAGSDFAAPAGTPIYAATDGVVVHVSCDRWEGRSPCNVQIDHGLDASGRRIMSLYVHMYPDGVFAQVGQTVSAGDHIAAVGSNGQSTGAHLHFEIWIDGDDVDPMNYLPTVGIAMP
ncbi:M23 family metallopeptidase [Occultella glacieicola]|uniref:M23 family metallopeptidase n=1 Tax=Occultella glacieicola TaxID=2518684 RepID=A0ABY2DWJ0_9MICO|nr:M23 family metallopeptidase [Occultella glacieicola]TDE88157.1 M23 family metallopeptidase [Occultella glacieicola]